MGRNSGFRKENRKASGPQNRQVSNPQKGRQVTYRPNKQVKQMSKRKTQRGRNFDKAVVRTNCKHMN